MVDALQLANDVTQTVVYYATPGLLWLFLYLVAWKDAEVGRDTGFGRRTFWILFPIGIIGMLGTLPFFAWDGDILAINLAGGIVPLVLSVFLLYRWWGRDRTAIVSFLGMLAVESVALFVVVLWVPGNVLSALVALAVVVGLSLELGVAGRLGARAGDRGVAAKIAGPFALASASLCATFLTTAPQTGVGIVSVFPFYLLAPIAVGFLAPVVSLRLVGGDGRGGLPLAYATTTFGVLVGADVLRQPPLYGSGPPALFSIGGAGLLDLLYLSGLIAAATAYLVYRLVRPWPGPTGSTSEGLGAAARTPAGLLYRAQLLAAEGQTARSVGSAADAAWAATEQTRLIWGQPPGRRDRPWEGLAVPPWIEADQRNLDALASQGPVDPREAERASVTANGLLQIATQAGRVRFPSFVHRSAAFGIDLAATLGPAILVWVVIAATARGSVDELLVSVPFNAAALGYAAYALVYFAVGEALFGVTLGKKLTRLLVTDRSGGRPGPFSVLVRNVPKLLPLTIVGVAGADIVAISMRGSVGAVANGSSTLSSAAFQALELLSVGGFVAIGLGFCLLVSGLAIYVSRERQRLGDYVAGTWVILGTAPPRTTPPHPAPGEAVRSG